MTKEFEQTINADTKAPAAGDLGQSKIAYGEQRETGHVAPGSEGSVAVRLQVGDGGIGSQETFDDPMKASPTGE